MTDPRDEARQRADWQANQCATQHLQPCNAHHCTLARDVLAGLERERLMQEVQADEIATNIRIAQRLDFWEEIESGLSYEDAEMGAFEAMRQRAEIAEARVAELQVMLAKADPLDPSFQRYTALTERISDLEEALRAIRDCSLPAIHGSNANEQRMRAIAAGALKPEEPKPTPESVAEQETRHNRERLKLQAESWEMAELEKPAPPLGPLGHEFVPSKDQPKLDKCAAPVRDLFHFEDSKPTHKIGYEWCGQPAAAHRAKEE